MNTNRWWGLVWSMTLLAANSFAQPHGIDAPRVANEDLLIDELPVPVAGTYLFERVFPRLEFDSAIGLVEVPGSGGRLAVYERGGVVKSFLRGSDPAPSSVTTILDISSRVCADKFESGFVGLAYDPEYATTGHVYAFYSVNDHCGEFTPGPTSRLSRFTAPVPSSNILDPSSEEVLIELSQLNSIHHSGWIGFGLDEMLWVTAGDGFVPSNAQDTTNLLGKVLRIDVRGVPDAGLTYRIPPDNPFYDGGPAGISTRREIYSYGHRNPFRGGFDSLTGAFYVGDVGDNSWEEVDIIQPGANYGWPIMEGLHCWMAETCDITGLTMPITEFPKEPGPSAVIGGAVYHGSVMPELQGHYLYGDLLGKVRALRFDGAVAQDVRLLGDEFPPVFGYGTDSTGEIYWMANGSGRPEGIYVLRPVPTGGTSDFPQKLSDIPALLTAGMGQGHTVPGILPYRPSSELWSDNARKERYMAIPGLEKVIRTDSQGWLFPEKSILIKNFLVPMDERTPDSSLKRIETRLLYNRNGTWHGFSYEWNEAGTDATLLPASKSRTLAITGTDGQPFQSDWYYPSRSECRTCHSGVTNRVLGLNSLAMNSDFTYPQSGVTDNQLRALDHIELFDNPISVPADQLPRVPDYRDLSQTLESRAFAYLASNCSNCHQPGGTTPTFLDLRYEVGLDKKFLVDQPPVSGDLGVAGAKVVVPGDANKSLLWLRMNRRGDSPSGQMPPLATNRVHGEGATLIHDWIENLHRESESTGWSSR